MAILLDESARAVVARRRARGQDDRIYLRLERGSIRAPSALILAVGWMPHTVPDDLKVQRCTDDAEVYMGLRIARYVQSCDLVLSGLRLWRWQWLVPADPFAYERMREWEYTGRAPEPVRKAPTPAARPAAAAGHRIVQPDRASDASRSGEKPVPPGLAAQSVSPSSNLGSGTDGRDA